MIKIGKFKVFECETFNGDIQYCLYHNRKFYPFDSLASVNTVIDLFFLEILKFSQLASFDRNKVKKYYKNIY